MPKEIYEDRSRFQALTTLRNSNFRWFWLNGATQSMAQGMQFLAMAILVLDVTDSSYQLGWVIFAYGVPTFLFTLAGGIVADHSNRIKLLISTRVAVSALILTLAVLKITYLLEIWHIYVISTLLGTVQGLNMPARIAVIGDLVKRKDMMNAVALQSMVNQTGQIIGPALAGGVIELTGVGATLLINGGLYLSGIVFLSLIKELPPRATTPKTAVFQDLQLGLRCVWSTPVLYTVIALAWSFTFFGMSYRQVLPAFTEEVLNVGAGGTGLLWLGAGLGSMLGSFILASLGDFKRKSWLLVSALLLVGLFLILFAWSPWYWLSWIFFFFLGTASTGLFWPLANTLLQLNVPPELRGRVLSILQLAPAIHFLTALPLAMVAGVFSWPIAVTFAASMVVLIALWIGIWRPVLRQFEG